MLYFFKLFFIIFIFIFSFTNQSHSNEFDKVSACAGVVMGEGSSLLRDAKDEQGFSDSFVLGISAYYGEGLKRNRSQEDIEISESIISSNLDKIYLKQEWTAEVYEEVINCYRMLSLKILENSELIKNNLEMINQYIKKYKERFRRLISAS